MLKQVRLRKKKAGLEAKLREIRKQKRDFKRRETELEKELDEAEIAEDIAAIEDEIANLEEEIAQSGVEDKEEEIIEEIERIEDELAELADKVQETAEEENPEEERSMRNRKATREAMWARTRSNGGLSMLTREQKADLVKRSDVKEFLDHVRELKGKRRSVTGAELTIPTVVLDIIRDNLHRYSKLISKVNLKPVKGKARQHVMGTIPEGVWTEAIGVLNELTFEIHQMEMDGYKVGGYIWIHNSTLEDSDLNLSEEIIDMIGQAIGIAIDKAILYGTGKKMPLGIATRLAQKVKPSDWEHDAPEWVPLHVTNISKFDGAANSGTDFFRQLILNSKNAKANYSNGEKFWVMSSNTKTSVLAESLAFNAAGAIVAGMDHTMPVIGGEIIELDFIPEGDIFFGYPSLYLLVEREGGTFGVSEHVRFIEDQTVYKGTARYDGAPVMGQAFTLQNMNNEDPTTTMSFVPDTANKVEAKP